MAHPKQVNILNYVNKVFIPNLKSEIKPLKIQGTPVENCACRQSESLKWVCVRLSVIFYLIKT